MGETIRALIRMRGVDPTTLEPPPPPVLTGQGSYARAWPRPRPRPVYVLARTSTLGCSIDVLDNERDGPPLRPLPAEDAAWDWGLAGAGALATARGILRHHLGRRPANELTLKFARIVVAMDRTHPVITLDAEEIAAFVSHPELLSGAHPRADAALEQALADGPEATCCAEGPTCDPCRDREERP